MAEPEIVLLYKIPAGSLESLRVRSALCEMSITLREVRPGDTARTLGDLADADAPNNAIPSSKSLPRNVAPAGADLPESAMVFCGFSQDRLKLALSRLREAGTNPSCLKAVLTPTNRDWSLFDLLTELIRERDAFIQMRRQGRIHSDDQNPAVP